MKTALFILLAICLSFASCTKTTAPPDDYITIHHQDDNESGYKYAYECTGKSVSYMEPNDGHIYYHRPLFLLYTDIYYPDNTKIIYISRLDSTQHIKWIASYDNNKITYINPSGRGHRLVTNSYAYTQKRKDDRGPGLGSAGRRYIQEAIQLPATGRLQATRYISHDCTL